MQSVSIISIAAVALLTSPIPRTAQPASNKAADETEIRSLIAQRDEGKRIPPIVGDETPTLRTHDRGIENRVPGTARNTSAVRRLIISESGDMAYEYSVATPLHGT